MDRQLGHGLVRSLTQSTHLDDLLAIDQDGAGT